MYPVSIQLMIRSKQHATTSVFRAITSSRSTSSDLHARHFANRCHSPALSSQFCTRERKLILGGSTSYICRQNLPHFHRQTFLYFSKMLDSLLWFNFPNVAIYSLKARKMYFSVLLMSQHWFFIESASTKEHTLLVSANSRPPKWANGRVKNRNKTGPHYLAVNY